MGKRTETLECENCGRKWEREVKRGRKPTTCNDCKEKETDNYACPACERDFTTDHGRKIHLSRSHKNWVEGGAPVHTFCNDDLHGICMKNIDYECGCFCHTEGHPGLRPGAYAFENGWWKENDE